PGDASLKDRQRLRQSGSLPSSERPSFLHRMPCQSFDMGGCIAAYSLSSPSATLTGTSGGIASRTARQTSGSARPSGPLAGSLTSITSAPPANAQRASSGDRTLTSKPDIEYLCVNL